MCTGRIDLEFLLRGFSNDVDGIFIIGCRFGECNYITHGNLHALSMAQLFKRIMEYIGLNPNRFMIEFMSSGDGILFAETMNEFTKSIKEIGPLGKSEGIDEDELKSRLAQVTKLVPYIKIVNQEKLASKLDNEDAYDNLFTKEEIDKLFEEVVSYYIDPAKCQACGICARKCPVEAIEGGKGLVHIIDQDKCIKCGTCFEACPPRFAAITKLVSEPVPPPPPEEARAVVRKSEEK